MKKHKDVTGKQLKYRGRWFEVNQTDGILYRVFDDGEGVCYEREYYSITPIFDWKRFERDIVKAKAKTKLNGKTGGKTQW